MEIKQYEIVLVNLNPTIGSEMKKTRPCVVISPDEMNAHLRTITIAPVTSTSKEYPTRVKLSQKELKGWIVLDQIRTINRIRIVKLLGKLTEKEITETKNVLKEIFVD